MDNDTTTVKFKWQAWGFAKDYSDEDMRDRDMAAEAARRWARVAYPDKSADVLSINRGRRNYIVTLVLR